MSASVKKTDYAISLVRLLATMSVVACHLFEHFSHPLYLWLNVGVQIFLCMSGYLYGKRRFDGDDVSFFKKQFPKILLDCYVVLIPVVILLFIFPSDRVSLTSIAGTLSLHGPYFPGSGHFWYIPYCLLCYLITPLLSRVMDKITDGKSIPHIVGFSLLFAGAFVLVNELFVSYFESVWMLCYLVGFFFGRISLEERTQKLYKPTMILLAVFGIPMNIVQILQNYVWKIELPGIVSTLYGKFFCKYARLLLGVLLFFGLKWLFEKLFSRNGEYPAFIQTIARFSDLHSFDFYLVHLFLMRGPFSLLFLTPFMPLNIIIALIAMLVAAMLVNRIVTFLRKHISFL